MAGLIHYPDLHSDQALPQGLPMSYEGTDSWVQDLFAYTQVPQASEETYSTASGLDPSLQSTHVRGHDEDDEGAGISYTDNISLPSTLLGFGGFLATPDEIATSSLMESGPRNKPNQPWRTGNIRGVASRSESSTQPAGEVLEGRFLCNVCGRQFAQRQGLKRHFREQHDPSSCIFCGIKWSRPYEYRAHLNNQHPDVDLDLVLGKAAGSRRKAPLGREQPPANKHDRLIQVVSLRPPWMRSAPAAVTPTPVSSTFSSTGEDPQPVNDVVDHAAASPGGSTAPDRSSRAVAAPVPTFSVASFD